MIENNYLSPGNRFRFIRNMLGLTQEGLGKKLGMEDYQIRDMESGKVEISMPMAKLLYYETGINPEWLLEGKEPMILETAAEALSHYGMLDEISKQIVVLLKEMTEEERREALRTFEERKLLKELLEERKRLKGANIKPLKEEG